MKREKKHPKNWKCNNESCVREKNSESQPSICTSHVTTLVAYNSRSLTLSLCLASIGVFSSSLAINVSHCCCCCYFIVHIFCSSFMLNFLFGCYLSLYHCVCAISFRFQFKIGYFLRSVLHSRTHYYYRENRVQHICALHLWYICTRVFAYKCARNMDFNFNKFCWECTA